MLFLCLTAGCSTPIGVVRGTTQEILDNLACNSMITHLIQEGSSIIFTGGGENIDEL
jgi:hypothetical protein